MDDWKKDSDTIFTAVSTSSAESFDEAKQMVVMMYVPDMEFTRAGISDALKRLEQHYLEKPHDQDEQRRG